MAEIKKSLSKEDMEIYINHSGIFCPYCGSRDISGNGLQTDGSMGYEWIDCLTCNRSWHDIWELNDIEEIDNQETE
jgi:formate dehydrogenase maturation protein FdhE